MNPELLYTDTKSLTLYRNILGNQYKDISDEEAVFLVNRIKGFCHMIINSYLKDFSEKKKNQFLFLHSEGNG